MSNEVRNCDVVTASKNAVAAPRDIDRGAAHRAGRHGRGARDGGATRLGDGLAFLRRFLARPHEVASTVWIASVLAAAGVPVQPLTALTEATAPPREPT